MNGKKYIETTSRVEILDLLRSSGPLTIGQIDKIRRKTRSDYSVRWLHANGYVGVLPTNPLRFVAGNKELAPPTYTSAMKEVLDALELYGPCSSGAIGEKLDRAREHVDAYFRAAKAEGLIHRIGQEQSNHGPGAYVWELGPGEDYVRPPGKRRIVKAVKTPQADAPAEKRTRVRRDPFIEAFYGAVA